MGSKHPDPVIQKIRDKEDKLRELIMDRNSKFTLEFFATQNLDNDQLAKLIITIGRITRKVTYVPTSVGLFEKLFRTFEKRFEYDYDYWLNWLIALQFIGHSGEIGS